MSVRKPMAAFAAALALWAWNSDEAAGQPRPPGPPMGGPRPPMGGPMPPMGGFRPPAPVMRPMVGPMPPGGFGGPVRPPVGGPVHPPVGVGGPGRPPVGVGGSGRPPVGIGPGVAGHPGGIAPGGLAHPGGIGPGGTVPPGQPPAGLGGPQFPGGAGPGGIISPGHPPGGPGEPGSPGWPGGPGGPGGVGGPGQWPGLGGLSELARSGAFAGQPQIGAVNAQALAGQAELVRNNFNFNDCFNGNWWRDHAGAWWAAGWGAGWGSGGGGYSYPSWGNCSGYGGYSSEPAYYDYGSNVVYQGDTVYVNGDAVASQEQYAHQATTLADTGKRARATKSEEWLSLGVFAMVQGEQVNGNDLLQLALSKSGVLRGNYYNALTDTTLPVYGSVDKHTQRAAWTVGDRKEPVFEAGIANLTKSETTMLVHFGKGRTQQWTLVRIEQTGQQK